MWFAAAETASAGLTTGELPSAMQVTAASTSPAYTGGVTTPGLVWAGAGIVGLGLLPIGMIRMLAYRSGEVDHTAALNFVALLAIGLGAAGVLVFLGLTAWFLVAGARPF